MHSSLNQVTRSTVKRSAMIDGNPEWDEVHGTTKALKGRAAKWPSVQTSCRQHPSPLSDGSAIIGVLLRVTSRLLYRILLSIPCDLVTRHLEQIDVELVLESDEVDKDIGDLLRHLPFVFGGQRSALLFSPPLAALKELSRLHNQSRCQVFRRVELIPIALRREAAQRVSKASNPRS